MHSTRRPGETGGQMGGNWLASLVRVGVRRRSEQLAYVPRTDPHLPVPYAGRPAREGR